MNRALGRSGIEVSAIGIGCWAIGGPFMFDGRQGGWGDVDDAQSTRAIEVALEHGVTLFDTADVYGIGHSERLLGRALAQRRKDVAIATKFGLTHDAATRSASGASNLEPDYIRTALAASLERLGTDYIDLYQLHVGDVAPAAMARVAETLEDLAQTGCIRAWGWSTDNAEGVRALGDYPHFAAVQQELSLLAGNTALLDLAEQRGLSSLNRGPLAMGLLSGKFRRDTRLPAGDVRAAGHAWVHAFKDGRPTEAALARLEALRDLLQTGDRTPAQGALGWLLAKSSATIPIPGVKTDAQVRDNAGALEKGPLPAAVMAEIDAVLQVVSEPVA